MTTGQAADIQVALQGHIKGGGPRLSVIYGVSLKMEQGRALLLQRAAVLQAQLNLQQAQVGLIRHNR